MWKVLLLTIVFVSIPTSALASSYDHTSCKGEKKCDCESNCKCGSKDGQSCDGSSCKK